MNITEEMRNFASECIELKNAKSRITLKLVNADRYANSLENRVFQRIADLAVVYDIALPQEGSNFASIVISNQILQHWGMSLEDLHRTALENTRRIYPLKTGSLESILTGNEEEEDDFRSGMLVASNEQNYHGAAVLLYPETDSIIRGKIGDYYILPSSIHEIIAIPQRGANEASLESMVKSINKSEVELEDQLSDHVYEYADGILKIATE